MKLTVEQIKDYFKYNRYGECVTIFCREHRGHDKIYIRMFGYAWTLDSIDERCNRAEFYNKELNAVLVGNLNPFREDRVTILYMKFLKE